MIIVEIYNRSEGTGNMRGPIGAKLGRATTTPGECGC